MKLLEAEAMAQKLFKLHGLELWDFGFDRARSRFGVCRTMRKTITLSKVLVELNEPERVKLTLLHEIAHALTPLNGHGQRWKAKLLEIGGDGKRCYSIANTVTPAYKPRRQSYNVYTADCACGTHKRHRRLNNRLCGRCKQPLIFS